MSGPNPPTGQPICSLGFLPPTPSIKKSHPTGRTCPMVSIKQEDEVEYPGFPGSVPLSTSSVTTSSNLPSTSATKVKVKKEPMVMMAMSSVSNELPISQVLGDFIMWLLDSGATSHFTPIFEDLCDPVELNPPVYIRVADRSRMKATHQGSVELQFTSDQGVETSLNLLHVLFVPGLQTRLFSIEIFVSKGEFSALYKRGAVSEV